MVFNLSNLHFNLISTGYKFLVDPNQLRALRTDKELAYPLPEASNTSKLIGELIIYQ
jgi:hypothetical protein